MILVGEDTLAVHDRSISPSQDRGLTDERDSLRPTWRAVKLAVTPLVIVFSLPHAHTEHIAAVMRANS